jgi:hypothetical protein
MLMAFKESEDKIKKCHIHEQHSTGWFLQHIKEKHKLENFI